jgi:predicted Zn-dependent protease with MMP-like domain
VTPDQLARRDFERLVASAVATLPSEIGARLENVDIVVEDEPSAETLAEAGIPPGATLYGYYQGIPQVQRGSWYSMALPDKITIFRRPIEAASSGRGQMQQMVRTTVIHEIAHHFGIGDAELRRLGL